jgi:hypothetical protein
MNHPKTLKMPSLSGLGKKQQGISKNQSISVLFDFEFSFQNFFWNLLNASYSSKICKIGGIL